MHPLSLLSGRRKWHPLQKLEPNPLHMVQTESWCELCARHEWGPGTVVLYICYRRYWRRQAAICCWCFLLFQQGDEWNYEQLHIGSWFLPTWYYKSNAVGERHFTKERPTTLEWFGKCNIAKPLTKQESKGLKTQFYCLRWLTVLLSQEFNLPDVLRLWDTLFGDPNRFQLLHYVSCSMIMYVQPTPNRSSIVLCVTNC